MEEKDKAQVAFERGNAGGEGVGGLKKRERREGESSKRAKGHCVKFTNYRPGVVTGKECFGRERDVSCAK